MDSIVEFVRWCPYFESEALKVSNEEMRNGILKYISPVSPEIPPNPLPICENGEKVFWNKKSGFLLSRHQVGGKKLSLR